MNLGTPFKAAVAAVAIPSVVGFNFYWRSAAVGESYLEKRGYSDIHYEGYDFLNTCGKNEVGRSFNATKNGKRENVTVCLGGLFRYIPIIE